MQSPSLSDHFSTELEDFYIESPEQLPQNFSPKIHFFPQTSQQSLPSIIKSDTRNQKASQSTSNQISTRQSKNLSKADMNSESPTSLDPHIVEALTEYALTLKKDWKKISLKIHKKFGVEIAPFFLRNYFKAHLAQKKTRTLFSKEQDESLWDCVAKFGTDWSYISKNFFNDQDCLSVRNRYYALLRKRKTYNFSKKRSNTNDEALSSQIKDEIYFEQVKLSTSVKDLEFKACPHWYANFMRLAEDFAEVKK